MKNYKATIHLTKTGKTEIREAEFGGKNPDESLTNMMEMAFAFGRDPEIENFSIMSLEEIEEFSAAPAATAA
jgi:hypothetical protein